MEKVLLANLAINQSFDAALKQNKSIDAIIAPYIAAIMLSPDASTRASAIAAITPQLLKLFQNSTLPAAQQIARTIAVNVVRATAAPTTIVDQTTAQTILMDLKLRPADRVAIVQHMIDDYANTLSNGLLAFWKEPGLSQADKLATLKQIFTTQDAARKAYDAALQAFYSGENDARPKTPKLDFLSRFSEDARNGFRVQARRAGADAELATFINAGFDQFAWITVNGTDACPDCRKRQGAIGDTAFWDDLGRPGDGRTVCKQYCFCMLVPAQTLISNSSLNKGLYANVKGVLTTPQEAAELNSHRP